MRSSCCLCRPCQLLNALTDLYEIWYVYYYVCGLLIDGVWIGYWIYWPLTGRTTNNYSTIAVSTLYSSLLHAIVSSVYYSLHWPFPGNGFQHRNYSSLSDLLQISYQVFSSQPDFQLTLNCWQSQSHIATDGGAHDQIFITLWQLRSYFCRTASLTRGRVCRLQFPLVLASAVIFRSESLRTGDHILSQFWDFPFRRLLRLAGLRWRYSTPPPHG
jgi:hypothetical protein